VTILVLGRSGQVARALNDLSLSADEPFEFVGRERCDLADTHSLSQIIEQISPSAIINAAAYTAVDAAETDLEGAHAINVAGPAFVAQVAGQLSVPFVHLSTDYVFDGTKEGAYVETDPTNPINVYGLTKRDGETAILLANRDSVVLRTSWVYSPYGKNFLRTMLTLAQTKDALSIVDDQVGAPTSAHDIASACLRIAKAKQGGHRSNGIFHMTGGGHTTWRGFAEAAFDSTLSWRGGQRPTVTPVPSTAYPTPARRPLNSRLNCDHLDTEFGIRLAPWQTSLLETLGTLKSEFGERS
jgi:dTDP-4-dehydrorhamnose reductase